MTQCEYSYTDPWQIVSLGEYVTCFKKESRLKLYWSKQEMNNERNVFLVLLAFNALIPVSFLFVEAPLKLIFWYGWKLRVISFKNTSMFSKSYPWDVFSLKKTRKNVAQNWRSGECGLRYTCIILCFTKKKTTTNKQTNKQSRQENKEKTPPKKKKKSSTPPPKKQNM